MLILRIISFPITQLNLNEKAFLVLLIYFATKFNKQIDKLTLICHMAFHETVTIIKLDLCTDLPAGFLFFNFLVQNYRNFFFKQLIQELNFTKHVNEKACMHQSL